MRREDNYKGYRVKLYLNDEQRAALNKCFLVSRYTWNLFLSLNQYCYLKSISNTDSKWNNIGKQSRKFYENFLLEPANRELFNLANKFFPDQVARGIFSEYEMKSLITKVKALHTGQKGYIYNDPRVAATVSRSILKKLDISYKLFWRWLKTDRRRAGLPLYKKDSSQQFALFDEGINRRGFIRTRKGLSVQIPKIGRVAASTHRHVPKGTLRSLVITSNNGNYYAIGLVKQSRNSVARKRERHIASRMLDFDFADGKISTDARDNYYLPLSKLVYLRNKEKHWKYVLKRKRAACIRKQKRSDCSLEYSSGSPSGHSIQKAKHSLNKTINKRENVLKYSFDKITTSLTKKYSRLVLPKSEIERKISESASEIITKQDFSLFCTLLQNKGRKYSCDVLWTHNLKRSEASEKDSQYT